MKTKKGPQLLADWMEKKGYTQADAARKIGVSRQLFNKWLNGESMQRTSSVLIEAKTGIPRDSFLVKGQ